MELLPATGANDDASHVHFPVGGQRQFGNELHNPSYVTNEANLTNFMCELLTAP